MPAEYVISWYRWFIFSLFFFDHCCQEYLDFINKLKESTFGFVKYLFLICFLFLCLLLLSLFFLPSLTLGLICSFFFFPAAWGVYLDRWFVSIQIMFERFLWFFSFSHGSFSSVYFSDIWGFFKDLGFGFVCLFSTSCFICYLKGRIKV